MDFLKDKKNLPKVVGIAVAVLVAMGSLIAFELGLFGGGGSPTPIAPTLANRGGPTPPGPADATLPTTPTAMPAPTPTPVRVSHAPGRPVMPGVRVAAVLPPVVVDPTKGPDPFSIPGGLKRRALKEGTAGGSLLGMKIPLRDRIPVFNLFKLQPPAPPPAPPLPTGPNTSGPAPIVRVVGIVNAADGIYAILEVNGQSQTVKPGDSLLDGSRVTAIQATSVTLRSGAGMTTSLPLTGGQGQTDQGGNGQDPNAGGPQFGQPPQQFGMPGQP